MSDTSEVTNDEIRELTRDEFLALASHVNVITFAIPVTVSSGIKDSMDLFVLGLDEEELKSLEQAVYDETKNLAMTHLDYMSAVWNGETK